jgi:hypothetical protein
MEPESLSRAFGELSTPLIADAALRLKIPLRISPPGSQPVTPDQRQVAECVIDLKKKIPPNGGIKIRKAQPAPVHGYRTRAQSPA